MKKPEEELELHIRPRATEAVSIQIPADTRASIKEVASQRDMSEQALLKLYIGQGLRQDLAKRFSDRVLDTTAQILARYVPSPEQVSAIMREIRVQALASA